MLKFLKCFLLSFVFFCSPVYACGPGTIFTVNTVWLVMWIGLIPLVLLKTFIFKRYTPTLTSKEIFYPYFWTSLFSTASIMPALIIFWYILLIIGAFVISMFGHSNLPDRMIVYRSFWDYLMQVTISAPAQPVDALAWSFPVACMILLIPLFFASSWVEGKMLSKFLGKKQDILEIKKVSWKANAVSYACLYAIALFGLCWTFVFYNSNTIEKLYHSTVLHYTTTIFTL